MTKINMLLLALLSLLFNCESKIDYGTIIEGTYSNSYLNFSINLPDSWVVQSEEFERQMMEAGMEVLAGDNEQARRLLDASGQDTLSLFTVTRFEYGAPVENINYGLVCIAEKVSAYPGIRTGRDYLFHLNKLLELSQVDFTLLRYGKSEITGIEFDIMESSLNLGLYEVSQKLFATLIKDYVLLFTLTYDTEEQEQELQNIVNTFSSLN